MLTVGLTGGIGSGKSTVAGRLADHGAVVIDADVVAREVVAPGTPGLQAVVDAFGVGVLDADGVLDRRRLAALVFADDGARRRLNAIVHPLIRQRTGQLTAAAAPDAVVVNDVPLLVETGLAPAYHLVMVVQAPVEQRIARLARDRGMSPADAGARIAAQADDDQRRSAADAVLTNDGSLDALTGAVDSLWHDRLLPYADNLLHHRPAITPDVTIVPYDPDWPRQFRRLAERIGSVAGDLPVAHIGSTAVPGLAAKDVIDIQLATPSLERADELGPALQWAGFPALPQLSDRAKPPPGQWPERLHGSADPGRPANLHLRVAGSPGWRYALLVRDWLSAEPAQRATYEQVKRRLAADQPARAAYAQGKEPWFDEAAEQAEAWAGRTGWQPGP